MSMAGDCGGDDENTKEQLPAPCRRSSRASLSQTASHCSTLSTPSPTSSTASANSTTSSSSPPLKQRSAPFKQHAGIQTLHHARPTATGPSRHHPQPGPLLTSPLTTSTITTTHYTDTQ
ncbi:uncharacterized protein THITE_2091171 [Thermothielavioides terrestris NRRL 8126]|uniref:Uncharacterized protein n=1 Tax=Thermothielavioides terrestris (strain ATCC 38088 / NRRL 8126) TaxID=578455 RepID=G2RAE3_THETT|nr:uncharacterized protein THITE_2091171 [Thermothielavioides terrestris NRRL 8126]AEO69678.1 hypothetical protein THITE_2091171 [Thermothielavioides terrestris NRRL 8126]